MITFIFSNFKLIALADVLFEEDHECTFSFVEDDFVNFQWDFKSFFFEKFLMLKGGFLW